MTETLTHHLPLSLHFCDYSAAGSNAERSIARPFLWRQAMTSARSAFVAGKPLHPPQQCGGKSSSESCSMLSGLPFGISFAMHKTSVTVRSCVRSRHAEAVPSHGRGRPDRLHDFREALTQWLRRTNQRQGGVTG